MTKQHENKIFWKKYDILLLLHLFFIIYDQIMSSLNALSPDMNQKTNVQVFSQSNLGNKHNIISSKGTTFDT